MMAAAFPSDFIFLGEFRPYRDPSALPCQSGLCFSGWVRHVPVDAPATSSRHWSVQLQDSRAQLLCDHGEAEFLQHCLSDGLETWSTGVLLFGGGDDGGLLLYPLSYSVWSTRGGSGALSAVVAETLAQSELAACVREALVRPSLPPCVGNLGLLLQRGGGSSGAAREALPAEVQRALVFVTSCETETRCNTALFHGQDAKRLGTSRFTYRCGGGANCVQLGVPPNSFPTEVLRGCLVAAHRADWLLGLLAALLATDDGEAGPTLVVTERSTAPFAAAALRRGLAAAESPVCLLALGDLDAARLARARVVLVTLELLCQHGEVQPQLQALAQRPWARLVSVGWPDVTQELTFMEFAFSYRTHLALALTESLQLEEAGYDASTAALLLGLSEAGLQEPLAVHAALQRRVLHLSPGGENGAAAAAASAASAAASGWGRAEVLRYAVRSAPAPDEAEKARLQPFHGAKRQMRLLFGSLCGSGKTAFAALPEGADALEHFVAQGARPTPFARAQLQPRGGEAAAAAECPVCFEPDPPVLTSCGHRFCETCLQQSLAAQRRCPACRVPLLPRDVVHSRPRPDPLCAYLGFLCELLRGRGAAAAAGGGPRPGRALLLASWGELHDRVAATLRRQGGLSQLWTWRGSCKQLCATLQRFHACERGALLLDPASGCFAVDWAVFQGVTDVYVLAPLQACERNDLCCQLRRVAAAAPGAAFTLVAREAEPRLPMLPSCVREPLPGLACPVCVAAAAAA